MNSFDDRPYRPPITFGEATPFFVKRGYTVQVQRFACAAGFFRPVENRNPLGRHRQRFDKSADIKGAIQAHFQHADALALRVQGIDRFLNRFAARPHHDDHALGIRRAIIFEEAILPPGQLGEFVHRLLHDVGACRRKTD